MDENNNIKKAPNVPPFLRYCSAIIPTAFDDSLSYYEALCALYKWMQDNLIDIINNNAAVTQYYIGRQNELEGRQNELVALFEQLKEYVDNYFNNLDVQEEINNKLDEMVEDGTLDEVIARSYSFYFKNVSLIGKFYQKLNGKSSVVINCQGDSLTYGQDTTSQDKRPASEDPVDDGSSHTQTRASITYPEELQADFDYVMGENYATINNLGFAGDTAKLSYNRWTKNRHADLALIMLGTNDSRSGATWVEAEYRNNISEYFEYLGKIVERYLKWNTGVILLTPPTFRGQNSDDANGNVTTKVYADALNLFAKKYSCPIVNVCNDITANFNSDFYSDNIHFNGTGYKSIADKLFAIFCGTGIINNNFEISSNYLFNASAYNCYMLGINTGLFNATPNNNQSANNKVLSVDVGGKLSFGFNVKFNNAIIIPICTNQSGCSITLDFESEQPLSTIKRTNGNFTYENKITSVSIDTAREPAEVRESIIRAIVNNDYILVNSYGYHNVTIANSGNTALYLNGFIVMPLEEARNYVKKLIFDLHGLTLTDNRYAIPLNLINFFFTSNIVDARVEAGKWSISPIVDLIISSGGGLVCYKMPLGVNNHTLPYSAELQALINSALSENRKYIDITYADTSHGSKSTIDSVTVDANNLIITFDTFNSNNTSIQIV